MIICVPQSGEAHLAEGALVGGAAVGRRDDRDVRPRIGISAGSDMKRIVLVITPNISLADHLRTARGGMGQRTCDRMR